MTTHTRTHTTVHGQAPCGCRMGIPNAAYQEIVTLLGCPHGTVWLVAVVDDQPRWVNQTTVPVARAFHASYETLAPQLGYTTRRATALPWERLGAASQLLMLLTAQEVLHQGVVALVPAAAVPDPDQGSIPFEEPAGTLGDWTRCRSCDAEIVWRRTEAGRIMPIDRHPVAAGNVAILDTLRCAVVSAGDRDRFDVLYLSHFTTCPNADQHRSGR